MEMPVLLYYEDLPMTVPDPYFFLLNSNAAIILAIIDVMSDTAQPNTWKVSSVLGDFFLFVLVMVYPPYISPLTELV